MMRSTLFGFIAVLVISLTGFMLLDEQGGFLGLIHSACFMVLILSGFGLGVALLGGLVEGFANHINNHTRRFCARCGKELFPRQGIMWSRCIGWKCENCGDSSFGADTEIGSAICLSRYCLPTTERKILKEVKNVQHEWGKNKAEPSSQRN